MTTRDPVIGAGGRPPGDGRGRTADLLAAVLVTGAVLGYVVDGRTWVDEVCYYGVLVGAALSACVAAVTAARGERRVPGLLAAGLCLSALGDVVWGVLDATGAATDVSLADPLWAMSYVVLCTAMWSALSRGRPGRGADVGFVVDALAVVAVSVLVFWHLSVVAILADRSVPALARGVWAFYPVADAVLLALMVRVLLVPAARSLLGGTFALGVVLWLVADVIWTQKPTGQVEVLMDAAWMVAPVLMARAAWRCRSVPPADDALGRSSVTASLAIAVVPLLVPPALEVVADLRGEPDRPVLMLTGSCVLVVLALVRTSRLVRSERAARAELEEARDAALEASRAKSMFVATMSHEIRTPLTTMLATTEMLEDAGLLPEEQALVRRMRRAGGLLHVLVEDVLDFSRIESGHLRLDATGFDVHELVDHVVETYEQRSATAGIAFTGTVGADVPRFVVGDPHRLHQVVGNLLDNAFKFTDAGAVWLEVRLSDAEPASGDRVMLELVVRDTGIGIAPDRIERVLEAFEQADGSSTRRHGGVGLGLAICRELVELMGGSLSVRSAPGVGSEFVATVCLTTAGDGDTPASRPLASRAT